MPPELLAEVSTSSSRTSSGPVTTLEAGLQAIGLDLPVDRVEALQRFLELLQRWNRVYNLTAVRDPQDMLVQHLLDALAVIPVLAHLALGQPVTPTGGLDEHAPVGDPIPGAALIATPAPLDTPAPLAIPAPLATPAPLEALAGLQVADIGSGAGIPGLILAIACPSVQLLSIEPVGKKCAFQQQVASELALAHVAVKQARAEQVTAPCDWVMCRALTSLAEFIRISAGLLKPSSRLAALKGRRSEIDAELQALPEGWQAEVIPVKVPGLAAERHLVVLHRS